MAADHDHDVWVGGGFAPQCWRMASSLRATSDLANCGWRRASRPPISTEVRVQSSALLNALALHGDGATLLPRAYGHLWLITACRQLRRTAKRDRDQESSVK